MVALLKIGDGYRFALEIPDGTHALVAEQLVAAAVNTGEHDDGHAGIHIGN